MGFKKDFRRAMAQKLQQDAAPGLEAAGRQGAKEHMNRKAKGANYAGKDQRTENPDGNYKQPKSGKRHLLVKAAQTGEAITEIQAVLPNAVACIDSKRGSKALRANRMG